MATSIEAFNSNSESYELIKNEINNLKKQLPNNFKETPYESNWAIIFNYKHKKTHELYEIVTRKEWDNYTVRIKKWGKLSNWQFWWQTQKFGNNETYNFSTKEKNTFNKELWNALNQKIWEERERLPKTGERIYNLLNPSEQWGSQWGNNQEQKENNELRKTDLKKKTIDLKYSEKNKEKKTRIEFPKNPQSVEWRITRCLRFASITDSIEDRYWIPRWLLMALMAQEWWWDPTVINLNGDWGAGLIHIQAINAAEYWMKTLPRFKWRWDKNNQIDYKHWAKLREAKEKTKDNLRKLSEMDDRFNPIMGIDVSARFLMGDKWWRNAKTWDDWIRVANRYAWRWMADYGYSVLVYWTTINKIRWNKMPTFKDKEINKVINWKVSVMVNKEYEKTDLCIERTKNAINKLNTKIDDKQVSLNDYYKYLEWQWDNYWLSEYIKYNKEHPYKK